MDFSPVIQLHGPMIELFVPGVVACTYNPATLGAQFGNGVGSVSVGGNSPSIGGWIYFIRDSSDPFNL